MESEHEIGYFDASAFSIGSGFADLASASASADGYASAANFDEDDLDDEFGRWLEVQSLRFRGKQIPE
jgi:hypothetical protein